MQAKAAQLQQERQALLLHIQALRRDGANAIYQLLSEPSPSLPPMDRGSLLKQQKQQGRAQDQKAMGGRWHITAAAEALLPLRRLYGDPSLCNEQPSRLQQQACTSASGAAQGLESGSHQGSHQDRAGAAPATAHGPPHRQRPLLQGIPHEHPPGPTLFPAGGKNPGSSVLELQRLMSTRGLSLLPLASRGSLPLSSALPHFPGVSPEGSLPQSHPAPFLVSGPQGPVSKRCPVHGMPSEPLMGAPKPTDPPKHSHLLKAHSLPATAGAAGACAPPQGGAVNMPAMRKFGSAPQG